MSTNDIIQESKEVMKEALKMDIDNIYEPVGCDECYKGYKGRIALQEVLVLNQEIRDLCFNNKLNQKPKKKTRYGF